jgi:hypothetical protein
MRFAISYLHINDRAAEIFHRLIYVLCLPVSSRLSKLGVRLRSLWQVPKSYCAENKGTNILAYKHKFGFKNWNNPFSSFLIFLSIKESLKYIIYLIKKLKQSIHNDIFLAFYSAKSSVYLLRIQIQNQSVELYVLSHCVLLQITNAWILQEPGAPVSAGYDCIKSVQPT